jgi:DNA-binding response OmpR family regulator
MKNILLCSSNPLLTKNLYCVLRDEGYAVEIVEHPASAVKMVLWGNYDFVIVDAEPFGMSAGDAAMAIQSVSPGIQVMFTADAQECGGAVGSEMPLDLASIRRTIHSIAV